MPGDGKRWLSWEKRGDFRIGQKGGGESQQTGNLQRVDGPGDFGEEQTHGSASEMMERRGPS